MTKDNFPFIKSIVSDCICKTTVLLKQHMPEQVLNSLANEYADKIILNLSNNNFEGREY